MKKREAQKILAILRAPEVAVDLQPWSRRFRAYTEMIKSGSPHEVAKVLRDMYRLKFDKELSFGERRLLDQAKSLLMKELAAAKKMTEAALQAQVDERMNAIVAMRCSGSGGPGARYSPRVTGKRVRRSSSPPSGSSGRRPSTSAPTTS